MIEKINLLSGYPVPHYMLPTQKDTIVFKGACQPIKPQTDEPVKTDEAKKSMLVIDEGNGRKGTKLYILA